ncbi:MAG: helix-hairpin-helix domain-containing protein, partial [Actinomycetota bacterium]
EVVRRRFHRLARERAEGPVDEEGQPRKFSYPPNLVLIDGGAGQLRAAIEGREEIALEAGAFEEEVGFAALAKRFEELHLPDRASPVVLPRGSDALYLVQRIRDEAHRFAVTYQRQRRARAVKGSALDDVPGVGPARRKALLRRFGSVKALREASLEELMGVDGVSRTIATAVREHLGGVHGDQEA